MIDNHLFKIIVFLSIVFWLFPPIRQYKGKYFLFFLALALSDPLSIVLGKNFHFMPYKFYNFSNLIAYIFLFDFKNLKKTNILVFIILFALSVISCYSESILTFYNIILINFLILMRFLKIALLFVIENSLVNLFHMVLILYEATNILKILSSIENFSSGIYYFAITNIFQILIAIFFSLYKEDNKNLYFDLKKFAN